MAHVVIAGGTGVIGTALSHSLLRDAGTSEPSAGRADRAMTTPGFLLSALLLAWAAPAVVCNYAAPSREGIGKLYLGPRGLAGLGAAWLERGSRQVVAAMARGPDAWLADLDAGRGYLVMRVETRDFSPAQHFMVFANRG